jgi:hypothetical protein
MPQVRFRQPGYYVGVAPLAIPWTSALGLSGACSEMRQYPFYRAVFRQKPSLVLIAPLGRRNEVCHFIFVSPDARI